MSLIEELRATLDAPPPLPGSGRTAERHRFLFALGRRDLSLARLAEAHWDAVAILAEAGREPVAGAVYGVWAAEIPGRSLSIRDGRISGVKPFCSGAGLVDRALVTVAQPVEKLFDVDARDARLTVDASTWHTAAFADTRTATVTFHDVPTGDLVGPEDSYSSRAGFWHGACGPAACWAGGAVGLVDWALRQTRKDPHTLAHLGAMRAAAWGLGAMLEVSGAEIDALPSDAVAAKARALMLRHLVEVQATDVLRRLGRAYGPHPLAFDEAVSRRCQELDLYLRQSHAERDLAVLGAL